MTIETLDKMLNQLRNEYKQKQNKTELDKKIFKQRARALEIAKAKLITKS